MTQSTQTTTFPAPVFAALAPAAYLHAHLSQSSPASSPSNSTQKPSSASSATSASRSHKSSTVAGGANAPTRPSGRAPNQPRTPALNTSSLTHTHGSAVVRAGETSVVVGVRAELVDAADVLLNSTNYSAEDSSSTDGRREGAGGRGSEGVKRARDLLDILIVPNVEYATGCNSSHIPGSAPSALAQSSAFLVKDLLLSLGVVEAEQLEIWAPKISADDEVDKDEEEDVDMSDTNSDRDVSKRVGREEIVAYYVLYIDCTILSLSGPALPHLWLAILAALRTTILPSAYFHPDLETVVCDPSRSEAKLLRTRGVPIVCTYAVFESGLHKGLREREGEKWVLSDPDDFEEGLCPETVLVVIDCSDPGQVFSGQEEVEGQEQDEVQGGKMRIRRIQKRGGYVVDAALLREIVGMARTQWEQWSAVLCDS